MMQYESIPSITKEDAEKKLQIAEGEELCLLLLSLSELDDWQWVQEKYLLYIAHRDKWVASAAITGLGDMVRIAGNIEKDRVVNLLIDVAKSRQDLEGKIHDAISDINMFYKKE